VASSHPEVALQLKEELLQRYPQSPKGSAKMADNATLERLKSLGYLA
jgi:hypothetical protein